MKKIAALVILILFCGVTMSQAGWVSDWSGRILRPDTHHDTEQVIIGGDRDKPDKPDPAPPAPPAPPSEPDRPDNGECPYT